MPEGELDHKPMLLPVEPSILVTVLLPRRLEGAVRREEWSKRSGSGSCATTDGEGEGEAGIDRDFDMDTDGLVDRILCGFCLVTTPSLFPLYNCIDPFLAKLFRKQRRSTSSDSGKQERVVEQ